MLKYHGAILYERDQKRMLTNGAVTGDGEVQPYWRNPNACSSPCIICKVFYKAETYEIERAALKEVPSDRNVKPFRVRLRISFIFFADFEFYS